MPSYTDAKNNCSSYVIFLFLTQKMRKKNIQILIVDSSIDHWHTCAQQFNLRYELFDWFNVFDKGFLMK